jgi:hypothetical protein
MRQWLTSKAAIAERIYPAIRQRKRRASHASERFRAKWISGSREENASKQEI